MDEELNVSNLLDTLIQDKNIDNYQRIISLCQNLIESYTNYSFTQIIKLYNFKILVDKLTWFCYEYGGTFINYYFISTTCVEMLYDKFTFSIEYLYALLYSDIKKRIKTYIMTNDVVYNITNIDNLLNIDKQLTYKSYNDVIHIITKYNKTQQQSIYQNSFINFNDYLQIINRYIESYASTISSIILNTLTDFIIFDNRYSNDLIGMITDNNIIGLNITNFKLNQPLDEDKETEMKLHLRDYAYENRDHIFERATQLTNNIYAYITSN